jgi:hypothetical protein
MGKPRNNTAIDIYRDFRRDTAILINWLGDELATLDDNAAQEPDNWKFAGEVAHVRQQLRQIVMVLAILDVDGIEQEIHRRRK